jgi:hypothetical protein
MFHWNRKEVEQHVKHNEQEILGSETCGCLGCMTTFKPDEVRDWREELADPEHPEHRSDRTGICPHCGDALILGDRSGYQITDTFLEAMRMR